MRSSDQNINYHFLIGFSIPNLFVIGYGMDYAERYRNLPDICLMSPEHPE